MNTCEFLSKLVLSCDPHLRFVTDNGEYKVIDIDYSTDSNIVTLSKIEEFEYLEEREMNGNSKTKTKNC